MTADYRVGQKVAQFFAVVM